MIAWRAILRRVMPFALLGAMITLLVALSIAWWRPEGTCLHRTPAGWQFSAGGEAYWNFRSVSVAGAVAVERHAASGKLPEGARVQSPPWFSEARRAPSASDLEKQEQTQGDWMFTEVAFGWPFPALKYKYQWHTHPVGFSGRLRWFSSMHGGFMFAAPAPNDASFAWREAMHALPYRPVVLGLLVNTLFYGAAVMAVHGGATWLRRRGRRRRGLCAWCGYDLCGHDATTVRCPECGNTTSRPHVSGKLTPAA